MLEFNLLEQLELEDPPQIRYEEFIESIFFNGFRLKLLKEEKNGTINWSIWFTDEQAAYVSPNCEIISMKPGKFYYWCKVLEQNQDTKTYFIILPNGENGYVVSSRQLFHDMEKQLYRYKIAMSRRSKKINGRIYGTSAHIFTMVSKKELLKASQDKRGGIIPEYLLYEKKESVVVPWEVIEYKPRFWHSWKEKATFTVHYYMINGEEPVGKGLDIYGVNVILNEDLPEFIHFILKYEKIWEIRKLIKLCKKALEENKEIACLINDTNRWNNYPPRSLLRLGKKMVNIN